MTSPLRLADSGVVALHLTRAQEASYGLQWPWARGGLTFDNPPYGGLRGER